VPARTRALRFSCFRFFSGARAENAAAFLVAREFAAPGARRARAAVEAHYFSGAVPALLRVRRAPACAGIPGQVPASQRPDPGFVFCAAAGARAVVPLRRRRRRAAAGQNLRAGAAPPARGGAARPRPTGRLRRHLLLARLSHFAWPSELLQFCRPLTRCCGRAPPLRGV
jgi:hypothetical protein